MSLTTEVLVIPSLAEDMSSAFVSTATKLMAEINVRGYMRLFHSFL